MPGPAPDNGRVTSPATTARPLARVVAAVLDHDGGEITRRCALSLRPLRDAGATILVVDNASREPRAARLVAESGDGYEALTLPVNGGVAGGYNAALAWAAERGATHVLLLNNDTVVDDPEFGPRLLVAAAPGVAIVGPLVRDMTGAIVSAGAAVDWRRGRTRHIRSPDTAGRPYPVEWVHGACMLVSVDAYRALGGFDETFFMYWEDVDLCLRAWQRGYRCVVEPRASIRHVGGATVRSGQTARFILRNALLFMRKHGSTADHAVFLCYFIARRLPVHVIRNAWPPGRLRQASGTTVNALAWNVRHARAAGRWRLDGLRARPRVR
jgi:N-acetylglucosaminyl-diphospho-decaprenol L-rhamnosyltransferase